MNNVYLRTVSVIKNHLEDLKRKAKEHQGCRIDLNDQLKKKSFIVDDELAKIAGVSKNTIERVTFINNSKNENLISDLCLGKISINKAFRILKDGNSSSCVYFIISENEKIKIGTTCCLDYRFKNLQINSPCDLKIIGIIKNAGIKKERQLHEKFQFCHSHGEWFDAYPDLLEYIENETSMPGKRTERLSSCS